VAMNVTIRHARNSDAAEHARMRAALWPDEDPDELAAEIPGLLADANQLAVVAERADGLLGGFAEASVRPFANGVDEQPCAFLEAWRVDEDLRHTGLGRALVSTVEEWARGRGFKELGSDALLENSVSHAAHRALGFVERERVVCFRKRL
jgi:aminoglycoside 6'-N-acetyltransferase I